MFYTVLAQVGVCYCFFMNTLYDLSINKVTDLGFGVAELNGKDVFVDGTYTGEKVKVLISGRTSDLLQCRTPGSAGTESVSY